MKMPLWLRRSAVVVAVMITALVASISPAQASGGIESKVSKVLIGQSIAIMVNQPDDPAMADEKLADAQKAEDQAGVDLVALGQARDALAAGDAHRARSLAERSIGAKPHANGPKPPAIGELTPATTIDAPVMPMARGAEVGAVALPDPLEVQRDLSGSNAILLALALLAIVVGVGLSIRFRPIAKELYS